ncbi:MAG: TIM barrel protein [Planctomycetes bacterium]|nr:TIM barrel protein [Planctomycetota bacterium]
MTAVPLQFDRRRFLGVSAAALGTAALPAWARPRPLPSATGPLFSISLAEWSLHRALRKGELDHLDFPARARSFGIDAVEYVNTFWPDKADAAYVEELRKRCAGEGVQSVLIMCDGEGALGDPNEKARAMAVENHRRWLEAAKALGCHSIRVNAQSAGAREEQQRLAAAGLHALCELADPLGIDVIVENHGGLSSDGAWLAGTLRRVDHRRIGSLPDFGNFRIDQDTEYDRYRGTDELMPFARGVSAKSHDFDDAGDETHTDYRRMLDIVVGKHGYHGRLGIEYEGDRLSEPDGILATKRLLERVREEMAARPAPGAAADTKKDGG